MQILHDVAIVAAIYFGSIALVILTCDIAARIMWWREDRHPVDRRRTSGGPEPSRRDGSTGYCDSGYPHI